MTTSSSHVPASPSGGPPGGPPRQQLPAGAATPRSTPRSAIRSAIGTPRQLSPTDVKRLNRDWRRRTEVRLALLLDSVGQPFNLGSIVRTAAALGAGALWLCGDTPDLGPPAGGQVSRVTQRVPAVTRA